MWEFIFGRKSCKHQRREGMLQDFNDYCYLIGIIINERVGVLSRRKRTRSIFWCEKELEKKPKGMEMEGASDGEQIDFVNPVFIWLSSIDPSSNNSSPAATLPGRRSKPMAERPRSLLPAPSSPFLRAKTALKRTFSSGHYGEMSKARSM